MKKDVFVFVDSNGTEHYTRKGNRTLLELQRVADSLRATMVGAPKGQNITFCHRVLNAWCWARPMREN